MPKLINTPIAGLKIIQLDIFHDERGFFVERFNREKFAALDNALPLDYFQDNASRSLPRVLRGLHYQNNPQQAKLVGCTMGRVWDVALDLRPSSPTFGQHFATELSIENGKLLFIPAGFAHGFCVLGDDFADVIYKVDNKYNKDGEGGIVYNDPDLHIKWPIKNPILSAKDAQLQSFKNYTKSII